MPAFLVNDAKNRLAKFLEYGEQVEENLLLELWKKIFPLDRDLRIETCGDGERRLIYND